MRRLKNENSGNTEYAGTDRIGQDEWKQVRTSKVFSTMQFIHDMLKWAKAEGFKDPDISDLQFSKYAGE